MTAAGGISYEVPQLHPLGLVKLEGSYLSKQSEIYAVLLGT